MDITRFDLPDGQWADIHNRPSHGQVKSITRKLIAVSGTEDVLDIQTHTLLILVDKWLVRDGDGRDLPLSTEGVDNAPQEIVARISDICEKALAGASPELASDVQRVKGTPGPN